MATMNISLPDALKEWVERQTGEGYFSNSSDYVRDLIRKDQERRSAIAALQTAITAGLASGEAERFDIDGFKGQMRQRFSDK